MVAMLAELPDLWDIQHRRLGERIRRPRALPRKARRSPTSTWVKKLTTKPVVGVGRFTSPDTMVRGDQAGIIDLIGAARPSIADPFLPKKIEEGRLDDIRECIGCNICVPATAPWRPIRCTQNPTMGEEWRRAGTPNASGRRQRRTSTCWSSAQGPPGSKPPAPLGQRGYRVTLAEAAAAGGRVVREAALPGMPNRSACATGASSRSPRCPMSRSSAKAA